ncbi:MAG: hypothetical protein MUO64_06470, partial [Anaerolineales bacterium]|nr:hypothetical protein [Anaerolineales bacterium]
RRFKPEEVRKYKREWESLNFSSLKRKSVLKKIEAAVLRAGISQLMVQAIAFGDTKRRLEALEQIETHYIYLGMQKEALESVSTILLGSVWGDAAITAACAERIHHLFWGLPGPEHVPIKANDVVVLKKAIHELGWIGEHATENLRSTKVMQGLCTSILDLYNLAVAYSRNDVGMALLSVVEVTLKACFSETEFEGIWGEGIVQIHEVLASLNQLTPKRWKKSQTKIGTLLATGGREKIS